MSAPSDQRCVNFASCGHFTIETDGVCVPCKASPLAGLSRAHDEPLVRSSPRWVTEPGPEPGEVSADQPHVRELLQLWSNRELEPLPVTLGSLPEHATPAMRAVASDIQVRLGLLLADGVTRALPYARSEAVRAGFVSTLRGASYVLRRLEDERVIRCVGEMPKLGKGNGTKLFVPPCWRPADPRAIELAGEDGLADVVWIPSEPRFVGRAVQPRTELANDVLVGEGLEGAPHRLDWVHDREGIAGSGQQRTLRGGP